jgi:hypothetical protein
MTQEKQNDNKTNGRRQGLKTDFAMDWKTKQTES